MQRQFDRLLEMLLLKRLDRKDDAKVRAYRLQVKSRLYRFNYVSPLLPLLPVINAFVGDALPDDTRGTERSPGKDI